MAIWRGTGGPGDATTDASAEASAAANSAASAASSASAAASSAASAASDATSASTSATNSETAKNASVAARDAAQTAQTAAETAKTDAQTAQTASENAQSYAEEWATQTEDTLISTPAGGNGVDDYSSMHHAIKAAASASSASSSASSASSSASTATTKASEASTSAVNAATSESNAATSEANAAASYDAFDDRYLGAKASAPTVDNDGDALLTGALYWDTGVDQLYIWDGSNWNEAAFSVTGAVTSFNTRTGAVTLNATDVNTALGSDAVLDSDIGSTVQAYSAVLDATTASYTTAEETKLAGIETGATADQTGAEIKAAYELETNAFTDAQFSKLAGIESGATADQTAGEIKTAYESNANTNAFTDAEQTKLTGIETGATADQTASEIMTAIQTVDGTGSGLDADLLDGIDSTGFATAAQGTLADSAVQPNDSPSFAGLTVDTDTLSVDSTNNRVGIGTSSPANKLEVSGAIVAQGAVTAYTNTGLYLQNKGSSIVDVGAWRSGASVAELSFSTDSGSDAAPVERMRIDSNGNVGIGTTNPAATVDVSGNARGAVTTDNDLSFDLSVGNNFSCTPTGTGTLTFTNHLAGQSGFVLLDNSGGHAITAAATTKINATDLTTISTAGVYVLSYFDNGTNAYIMVSRSFA
jgi:hypothetical protein